MVALADKFFRAACAPKSTTQAGNNHFRFSRAMIVRLIRCAGVLRIFSASLICLVLTFSACRKPSGKVAACQLPSKSILVFSADGGPTYGWTNEHGKVLWGADLIVYSHLRDTNDIAQLERALKKTDWEREGDMSWIMPAQYFVAGDGKIIAITPFADMINIRTITLDGQLRYVNTTNSPPSVFGYNPEYVKVLKQLLPSLPDEHRFDRWDREGYPALESIRSEQEKLLKAGLLELLEKRTHGREGPRN